MTAFTVTSQIKVGEPRRMGPLTPGSQAICWQAAVTLLSETLQVEVIQGDGEAPEKERFAGRAVTLALLAMERDAAALI